MAYNNPYGYSANNPYNPWPQQQPQLYSYDQRMQQSQQPRRSTGMTWVQGEVGAKSFMPEPNTTVPLFDSEQQTIYFKSVDSSGMPSMRVADYVFRDQNNNNNYGVNKVVDSQAHEVQQPEYVTKEDFNALAGQINNLANIINNMSQNQQPQKYNNKKKEDYDHAK